MRLSLIALVAVTAAGCSSSAPRTAAPRDTPTHAVPRPTAPAAQPVDTMLLTCDGKGVVRPATLVTACGDGSSSLKGLSWASFTAATAVATGTESTNNCDPNCAQGRFLSYRATFTFSNPVHLEQGWYFRTVTTTYTGPTPNGTRVSVNNDLVPTESSAG
jgi:hypothetical protein